MPTIHNEVTNSKIDLKRVHGPVKITAMADGDTSPAPMAGHKTVVLSYSLDKSAERAAHELVSAKIASAKASGFIGVEASKAALNKFRNARS